MCWDESKVADTSTYEHKLDQLEPYCGINFTSE